jgi:hypothetical protein
LKRLTDVGNFISMAVFYPVDSFRTPTVLDHCQICHITVLDYFPQDILYFLDVTYHSNNVKFMKNKQNFYECEKIVEI